MIRHDDKITQIFRKLSQSAAIIIYHQNVRESTDREGIGTITTFATILCSLLLLLKIFFRKNE